jgi:hypothetical protein
MRSKTIFGALLVSVALCSQGFGFELLDRMLGLNGGGCGECKACAKVACCEKACCPVKCCAPKCEVKCCAPKCEVKCCAPKCCEKACCEKACCEKCKVCRPTPVRDLFANIKELFEAKGCQCEPVKCCEAKKACCCPEPACCKPCHKVRCCEKAACCAPTCEKPCKQKCHKLYRRPVLELLEALFGCEDKCNVCCDTGCGGAAPAKTPAKAPESPAPLPTAPKAPDPSASTTPSRGIYQASNIVVRN